MKGVFPLFLDPVLLAELGFFAYRAMLFLYTHNLLHNKKKQQITKKDTAGSMLYHINPVTFAYKGSYILYAIPQKWEGRYFISL